MFQIKKLMTFFEGIDFIKTGIKVDGMKLKHPCVGISYKACNYWWGKDIRNVNSAKKF